MVNFKVNIAYFQALANPLKMSGGRAIWEKITGESKLIHKSI